MNIIFTSRDTLDFSEFNFMLRHCTLNLVFMKDFFSKCYQIHRKLDLVTFTEEIFWDGYRNIKKI